MRDNADTPPIPIPIISLVDIYNWNVGLVHGLEGFAMQNGVDDRYIHIRHYIAINFMWITMRFQHRPYIQLVAAPLHAKAKQLCKLDAASALRAKEADFHLPNPSLISSAVINCTS